MPLKIYLLLLCLISTIADDKHHYYKVSMNFYSTDHDPDARFSHHPILTPLFDTYVRATPKAARNYENNRNAIGTSLVNNKVASMEDKSVPAIFTHGESPVWDAQSQSLLFVDVVEQNVHRLDYNTGRIATKHIHYGEVNVVTTVERSQRLLVAVRASLFLMDWATPGDGALRPLTTVDLGLPNNVINEGKADSTGRFWAGTKGPQNGDEVLSDRATFYSISSTSLNNPVVQIKPVTISNGLAWSLNNTVLYYIDSPTQKVEAFDFDLARGTLSGRRTIIDVTLYGYDDAIPDGMTIDNKGNLWVALMFGGTILHVDPDARHVIYGYRLPVSRTTSVTWGGPNLDELFVTTSKHNVNEKAEPLAGAIFTIRDTGSSGVLHYPFRIEDADYY